MQANFDAAITLDIGPFISSINKAQTEVAKLAGQLDALNKKNVSPTVSVGGAGASVGSGSSARAGAAAQEIATQKQLDQVEQQRFKQARASQRQQEDQARSQEKNLARERYALYDVAAAYTAVAGAASAAVFATAGTAINFERAFVDVERTTDFVSAKIGAAAESAKNDLKSLASEIPVAFGQITQIATIGNQLGIAQGALTSFTETVAKFSTTTGVSVESTAMSFGRIGELLQVDPADFEKMGSAIAFAGVNAVATEAQILSVTKEIATTAKMANFSTPDIIGLSTALSSLGIAPEAARGSIIRTFAGINKAVSEGGDALEEYARIAGMPSQQFAQDWADNGQLAFGSFLKGLQGLADGGANLDSVLRNLGMVNVRDIQTVQKLGDNYDVYTSSIKDANQGFDDGTFLAESYGKVQETVASKILLVSNNIANLLDTIGQTAVGDGFKGLLDIINDVLVRLNQFAKTPIGQFFSAFTVGAAAFLAVFASINAVSALAQASLRAFATAQSALVPSSAQATGAIATMNTQLGATAVAGNLSALGIDKAKVAAVAFNNFLKTVKWAAIITAVIAAVQQMGIAFSSAEQKAESLLGGFSGAQDALRADIDAYNAALTELGGDVEAAKEATGVIAELNTSFENNNEEVNKAIEAKNALNEVLGITSENEGTLSTSVEDSTLYIGENTRAWLINAIVQSDAFQAMSKNIGAMESISTAGFNMNDAMQAAANGTLDTYFNRVQIQAIQTSSWFEQMIFGAGNLGGAVRIATQDMGFFGNILTWVANTAGDLVSFLGRAAGEVARFFGMELFPTSIALEDLETATQGAFNQFKLLGPAAAAADEAIAAMSGNDGPGNLEEDVENLGKSLRTVVDYANDLRGVFSRAFEIRFGRQQSLDDIASGWNNIAEKAASAAKEIRDANASIGELAADRSILKYQLSVAERYGDEQRAAVIRAKIAKVDEDIAEKKEDINDATVILTRSTQGSTDSAIENRNALLGQLGSYTDLIEMYSKTGLQGEALEAKVEELKEQFIQQAIAAGYSREELEPYIGTFDDLREAIQLTPRNVDIEFRSNVSFAQQAVDEFIARTNGRTATVNIQPTILPSNTVRLTATPGTGGGGGGGGPMMRFLARGGYVDGPGTATSDSVPAMLSKGEYVVKASAVGAYGVDFMNALNQQKVGSFNSSASSAVVGSGSNITHLSPEDRALLRAALDRPVNLYTDSGKIASSANAGNVLFAQRGSR